MFSIKRERSGVSIMSRPYLGTVLECAPWLWTKGSKRCFMNHIVDWLCSMVVDMGVKTLFHELYSGLVVHHGCGQVVQNVVSHGCGQLAQNVVS